MIVRLVAVIALAWALGFALFVVMLPGPRNGGTTDAVVVTTGGPGRITRGAELLMRHQAQRMLISGVAPETRAGDIAANNALSPKLFACCVDLGREASDTRSNALETVAWARAHRYRSVRLVTTDWHMPRARFELERVAGDITIVDDAVDSKAGFGVLMREYNKYLLRRIAAPVGL